ncbi:MAG TPA: hypothetical protein V6D26_31835 [Stenomitos sp.]
MAANYPHLIHTYNLTYLYLHCQILGKHFPFQLAPDSEKPAQPQIAFHTPIQSATTLSRSLKHPPPDNLAPSTLSHQPIAWSLDYRTECDV